MASHEPLIIRLAPAADTVVVAPSQPRTVRHQRLSETLGLAPFGSDDDGAAVQVTIKEVSHGPWTNGRHASVIVTYFHLQLQDGGRFVSAAINYTFRPKLAATASDHGDIARANASVPGWHSRLTILEVAPVGYYPLRPPGAGVSSDASVDRATEWALDSGTVSAEKASISGATRTRYRERDTARWLLTENSAQSSGVPENLHTAVLVERGDENSDFVATIEVSVTLEGNPSQRRVRAFGGLSNDHPIKFDPQKAADMEPRDVQVYEVRDLDEYWKQTVSSTGVAGREETTNEMPTTTSYDRIYHKIETEMLNRQDGEEHWLPHTLGRELLAAEDIAAALKGVPKGQTAWNEDSTPELATFIRDRALQLFVMLVYTKNEALLEQFYKNVIGDAMFPLTVKIAKSHASITEIPHVELQFGPYINRLDADTLFNYWQWLFFVPRLRWTAFDQPPLDSRCNLPFLAIQEINRTDFSIVYMVVIHRDHVELHSNNLVSAKGGPFGMALVETVIFPLERRPILILTSDQEISTDSRGHPYAAVKQLLPAKLKKEDFTSFVQAEYETLDMLRGMDTQHLIKAAAFYRKGNSDCSFVFPWARHGNLRRFWEGNNPSIYDINYMKWVFGQLCGLADAIRTLHHNSDRAYRHGDIKPENVLCFNSSGSGAVKDQTSYVLVISDFGLARIHDKVTQLRSRTRLAGGETIVYAAPEIELYPDHVISRRYDIWSLGCLYLEFVIWLLYGFEELKRFHQGIDGRFYTIRFAATTITAQGMGNKLAEINQTAKDWIHRIKNDPRCGGTGVKRSAIGRLIVLIEERLLVVGANPNLSNPLSAPDKLGDEDQGTADFRAPEDIPPFEFRLIRPTMLSDEGQNNTISQMARFADSGKDERAYAPEVCNRIDAIIQEVENGAIAWVNRESTPRTDLSLSTA